MRKNNGISLIVLVITIIVIIILAGAVILSLSNNNPIAQATEASYKTSVDAYNSELSMTLSGMYVQNSSFNPNNFYVGSWDGTGTGNGTIKQYIPSMTKEDGPKYVIAQGKLEYIGSDATEKQWSKNLGITDGLILWLDGSDFKNSPQTVTWLDKSGNGNNATCNTFSYTAVSGSDGAGSVVFDGSSDYAVVNYNFPETLTVETWANAITIDNKIMWSFDGTNYTSGPDVYAYGSKFHLNIGDGAANPFANQIAYPTLNAWHHYVVVFDKTSNLGTLYLDGALVGTATYKNPTSPRLYIGKYDSNNSYNWYGSIKSFKVYNRVLSASEILANYNASK